MGTSVLIPMPFLTLSFANIIVEGLENGQGEMSMSLKEEIKLELMEEMRRELEEKVESLVEKRVDNLRQELEVELLGKLMRNESLWRSATAATLTPQHIICATQVNLKLTSRRRKNKVQLVKMIFVALAAFHTYPS